MLDHGRRLNCDFGDLAPGASRSVDLELDDVCVVRRDDKICMASSDGSGSDEDSDEVTVLCPDIEMTKTADDASVSAGEEIGFTITVSDAGPGVAKDVTIYDALPTGTGVVWVEGPNTRIARSWRTC